MVELKALMRAVKRVTGERSSAEVDQQQQQHSALHTLHTVTEQQWWRVRWCAVKREGEGCTVSTAQLWLQSTAKR